MDALITDIILVWLIDKLFFFVFFSGSAASICVCVDWKFL